MNSHIPDEKKQETDEHILVCLSASPSNEKIIATAARWPIPSIHALQRFMYRMESDRNTLIRRDWKSISVLLRRWELRLL